MSTEHHDEYSDIRYREFLAKLDRQDRLFLCPCCDEFTDAIIWHCPRCRYHNPEEAYECRGCGKMHSDKQLFAKRFKLVHEKKGT